MGYCYRCHEKAMKLIAERDALKVREEQEIQHTNNYIKFSHAAEQQRDRYKAALEEAKALLYGAMTVVELWEAQSPAQIEWKKIWIKNARKALEEKR